MKAVVIVLILFWLSSCGENQGFYCDPEAEPYLNSFVEEGLIRKIPSDLSQLQVHFSETLPFEMRGRCDISSDGDRTITLNKVYWNLANEDEKLILVYHEAGHCLLGRGHSTNSDSLMTPKPEYLLYKFKKNREYYIDELFNF